MGKSTSKAPTGQAGMGQSADSSHLNGNGQVTNGHTIKAGDKVQWTIGGVDQFQSPELVTSVELGTDGQHYCRFAGRSAGALVSQCAVVVEELSVLDSSCKLVDLGYWPITIYPPGVMRSDNDEPTKGKEPIGGAWGLNRRTRRWLRAKFREMPLAGIGIGLGPGRAPGGLWLIDIEGDGPRAAESLAMLLGGEVILTPGWSSVRGFHVIFVVDGERLLKLLAVAGAKEGTGDKTGVWKLPDLPDLEIRIGGYKPDGVVKQVQSVVPPTPGTDGTPRAWTVGPETPIAELPDSAYAFLEAVAEIHAEREAIQNEPLLCEDDGKPKTGGMRAKVTARQDNLGAYGAAAIKRECDLVENEPNGTRNIRLNVAAFKLGTLVGAHAIDRTEAERSLLEAAKRAGLGDGESVRTIRSGLDAGITQPRDMSKVGMSSESNKSTSAPNSEHRNGKPEPAEIDYSLMSDAELGRIKATDVVEEPTRWLWPYRLAEGEMALLAGDGGLGKSQLLLAGAALITVGGEWPDGSGCAPLGNVIIVSAEDSQQTTLKPRLIALGADLSRITFLTAKVTISRKGKPPLINPVSLQDHAYWREMIRRENGECKLLIVDPLPSYLGRGVNDSKNQEIRAVLEPFIEMVLRPASVNMWANTHLNKNIDAKTPVHRITGSIAYANIPRNVHFVLPDPNDPERLFFKQAKCNNAPRNLPALAYRLEQKIIPSAAGDIETSFPKFEAETVQVDIRDTMAADKGKRGPKPTDSTKFAGWLWDQLQKGAVAIHSLISKARAEGLLREPTDKVPKPSVSSLYDARERLASLHPECNVIDLEVDGPLLLKGKPVRTYKGWALEPVPQVSSSQDSKDPDPDKNGTIDLKARALRQLMGLMLCGPVPRDRAVVLGAEVDIPLVVLNEAAKELGVKSSVEDGQEIWSLR